MNAQIMWFAICMTWGALSAAMGFSWDSWQFWTLFGLLWAAHTCGKMQGSGDFLLALEQELEKSKKEKE